MLLTLVWGAILAALVASIVATERKAEATFPGANGRIAFDSKRTMGGGRAKRGCSAGTMRRGPERDRDELCCRRMDGKRVGARKQDLPIKVGR